MERGPCHGLKHRKGVVCGNTEFLPGTGKCLQHGGSNGNIQDKAYRRGALAEVQRWSGGSQPAEVVLFPNNPFEVLQSTLNSVNDFKSLIERKIEAMNEEGEDWRFTDKAGGEQLRSEIALYERALDRAVRAATALSKLNIEERYLAISEKQATSIIYIISTVLQRIPGITESQKQAAIAMVGEVIEEMLTSPAKGRYV